MRVEIVSSDSDMREGGGGTVKEGKGQDFPVTVMAVLVWMTFIDIIR